MRSSIFFRCIVLSIIAVSFGCSSIRMTRNSKIYEKRFMDMPGIVIYEAMPFPGRIPETITIIAGLHIIDFYYPQFYDGFLGDFIRDVDTITIYPRLKYAYRGNELHYEAIDSTTEMSLFSIPQTFVIYKSEIIDITDRSLLFEGSPIELKAIDSTRYIRIYPYDPYSVVFIEQ